MEKINKKRSVSKFNIAVVLVLSLLTISNAGLWFYTKINKESIDEAWMHSTSQMVRNLSDPLKSAEYKIVDEDKGQVRLPLRKISLPMNEATMSANISVGEDTENPKILTVDVTHPSIWSAAYVQVGNSNDPNGKMFAKTECSRISATLRPSADYDEFDDYEIIKLSSGEKLAINKISKDCNNWYKKQNFDKLVNQTIDSLKQMRTY